MTARLDEPLIRGFEERGIKLISPGEGMRALEALLGHPATQMFVGECDWTRYSAGRPLPNALYLHLASGGDDTTQQVDVEVLAARPRSERTAAISRFVRAKVSDVLRIEAADELDGDAVFAELGLDSLMAVEFKNALEAAFRVPLPASVAFEHPSVGQLTEFIDQQLVPQQAG